MGRHIKDVQDRIDDVVDALSDISHKLDHAMDLIAGQHRAPLMGICFFCDDEADFEIKSDGKVLELCKDHDPCSWQDGDRPN